MKSSLLLNKIKLVQSNYTELLHALLPKLQTLVSLEALDEINLFWLRNISTVKLYLETISFCHDTFAFIAPTCIDYESDEHLPFLLIGNQHIIDDPLSRYSELCNNMSKGIEVDYLLRQIGKIAENNLKILENLNQNILIFPLRLLVKSSAKDELFKISERIFVNLFDGIEDLDDYFKKCCNFDDIIHYSCENFSNAIMFSENDDKSLPLKERFKCAICEVEFIIDTHKSDAYNFYAFVFGNIQQAVHIVASCLEYGCIPFVRSSVYFHYLFLVMSCLASNNENISISRYQMMAGFAIYKSCDRKQLIQDNVDVFLKKAQKYDFTRKLFGSLEAHGITNDAFSQQSIVKIVTDELQEFYNYLKMNEQTLS